MLAETASFSIVVAATVSNGIGMKGQLPWNSIPTDMKHFRRLTTLSHTNLPNAVIMGRRTWSSIPEKYRPLPNRINVILSTTLSSQTTNTGDSVMVAASLDIAIQLLHQKCNRIFIIGGGRLYEDAIASQLCTQIYMTRVMKDFDCDTFFPHIPAFFKIKSRTTSYDDAASTSLEFIEYYKGEMPQSAS